MKILSLCHIKRSPNWCTRDADYQHVLWQFITDSMANSIDLGGGGGYVSAFWWFYDGAMYYSGAKRYVHGSRFIKLCCGSKMLEFGLIHQGYSLGIRLLPQCQWRKPKRYGKIHPTNPTVIMIYNYNKTKLIKLTTYLRIYIVHDVAKAWNVIVLRWDLWRV